jgi:hypothetical protein
VEKITLNLLCSYPVKWNKKRVLRDFVQNFYDDLGWDKFGRELKHSFSGGVLELFNASEGFSYEWLTHIGASTKQDVSGTYAGYFGEGFKIASLCALRDHKWTVTMKSRDWQIDVGMENFTLDGITAKQLIYNLIRIPQCNDRNSLILTGLDDDDFQVFKDIVLLFYYKDNPLFGEEIFRNEYVGIFKRGSTIKPKSFPYSAGCSGDGIVYLQFQARGSFQSPLVICDNRYRTLDRERENIHLSTILSVLSDVIDYLNADALIFLLETLRNRWYEYPSNKEDVESYYSVVKKILYRIYANGFLHAIEKFKEKYPDLAVCRRPKNTYERNRRTQALEWKRLYCPTLKLVQANFDLFGYEDITGMCEKAGGYNVITDPDQLESRLIGILKSAVQEILAGFVPVAEKVVVINNNSSAFAGTALVTKLPRPAKTLYGHSIRYRLSHVEIAKGLLEKGHFYDALSVFCHELCHAFGADASASFSRALTKVIAIIGRNGNILRKYERQWDSAL